MGEEPVRIIDRPFVVPEDDSPKVCLFVFSGAAISCGRDDAKGGDGIADRMALASGEDPEPWENNKEDFADLCYRMTARTGRRELLADNNGFIRKK